MKNNMLSLCAVLVVYASVSPAADEQKKEVRSTGPTWADESEELVAPVPTARRLSPVPAWKPRKSQDARHVHFDPVKPKAVARLSPLQQPATLQAAASADPALLKAIIEQSKKMDALALQLTESNTAMEKRFAQLKADIAKQDKTVLKTMTRLLQIQQQNLNAQINITNRLSGVEANLQYLNSGYATYSDAPPMDGHYFGQDQYNAQASASTGTGLHPNDSRSQVGWSEPEWFGPVENFPAHLAHEMLTKSAGEAQPQPLLEPATVSAATCAAAPISE